MNAEERAKQKRQTQLFTHIYVAKCELDKLRKIQDKIERLLQETQEMIDDLD